MATGDLGITYTIEGGGTKSITIDKATYDLAKAYVIDNIDGVVTDDTSHLVYLVNKAGSGLVHRANKQQNNAAIPAEKTYTKAT